MVVSSGGQERTQTQVTEGVLGQHCYPASGALVGASEASRIG